MADWHLASRLPQSLIETREPLAGDAELLGQLALRGRLVVHFGRASEASSEPGVPSVPPEAWTLRNCQSVSR